MKASPAVWLYCLLRSEKRPLLGRAPAGPPDTGKPRLLDGGDGLWLLVSDAPIEVYGEAPLNARLSELPWVSAVGHGHEAVTVHARKKVSAVVPMKLFTLFRSDARALQFVNAERTQLTRVLDRLEGCSEFGVRVTVDPAKVRARAEAAATRAGAASGMGGAAFLARKSQLQRATVAVDERARQAATTTFQTLSALSESARRRQDVEGLAKDGRVLLDGVFLVKERQQAKWKAKLKTTIRALEQEGFEVSASGPWPPYHFVVDAA